MNGQDPSASSEITSQDPSLFGMVPNQNTPSSNFLTSPNTLSSSIVTSQYLSSNSIMNNEDLEQLSPSIVTSQDQSTPIVLTTLDPPSIIIGTSQVPSTVSIVSIQHPLYSAMSNPDHPSVNIVTSRETSSIATSQDPSDSSIVTRRDPLSCGGGTIREQSFSCIITSPGTLSSSIVTCPGPSSSNFVPCPGPSSSSFMTSPGPSTFSTVIGQDLSSSSNTSSQDSSYSYIATSEDSDTDEAFPTLQRATFPRRYRFICNIIRNELHIEEFLEEKLKSCQKSSCATEHAWKIQKELDDLLRLFKRDTNVRSSCVAFSVIKLYYIMRREFLKTKEFLNLYALDVSRFRMNILILDWNIDQILSPAERHQNIVPVLQRYLFQKNLKLRVCFHKFNLAWKLADTLLDNLFEKCNEADSLEKSKGLRKSIYAISKELYHVLTKISQRSCDCMDEAKEFYILGCYLLSRVWLN